MKDAPAPAPRVLYRGGASARALVACLADGRPHSGTLLAQRLGVSRAAVWKQIARLREWGVAVEAQRGGGGGGGGYRMVDALELLDGAQLCAAIAPPQRRLLEGLELFHEVDSTNRQAMKAPLSPGRAWACMAERQSAGQGRFGRHWISPFGRHLALSLAWFFPAGVAALQGLTLVVGVAVARLLGEMGVRDIGLKWPNDIMWRGRKLGGILVEVTGDPSGPLRVVTGLGLNFRVPASLGRDIPAPWTDLHRAAPAPLSRNLLAGRLLDALLRLLADFPAQGFAPYHSAWETLDSCRGQQVVVLCGAERHVGTALGITPQGELRLGTPEGEQHFAGGEVSLRLHDT